MSSEQDIIEALQRLRGETEGVVAGARVARMRAAMHADIARQPRWSRVVAWLGAGLPLRLTLAGVGGAAVAAVVLSVGWSSPPGAPLHGVQVARQWVQRSLPGADQSALLLSWTESDLRDAASGTNRAAALSEATTLLDECRDYATASAATLQRWQHDESTLDQLEHSAPAGSSTSPAPPAGDDTVGGQSGGDHGGSPGGSGSNGGPASAPTSAQPSESPGSSGGGSDGGSRGGPASPSPSAGATAAPSPTSGSDGGPGGGTSGGSGGGTSGGSGGPGPSGVSGGGS